MAGPWEKYQNEEAGPWTKYAAPEQPASEPEEEPGYAPKTVDDLRGPKVISTIAKGMGRGITDTAGSIADVASLRPLREDVSRLYHRMTGGDTPDPKGIGAENASSMNKTLGIEADPNASFGERVGGGFGEALTNPLSWVGGGGVGVKTAGALFGSAGAETAKSAAEAMGAPRWAQTAAGMAGGALGGAGTGGTSRAMREAEGRSLLAGSEATEKASQKMYKVLENDPTLIPPKETEAFHDTLTTWLDSHARDKRNAKKTVGYMKDYLKSGKPVRYQDLMNLHEKLGTISPKKEGPAPQLAREAVRDFIRDRDPNIGTALKNAINDWNVKSQVEELERVKQAGKEQAAVTGWGGNAQNKELQGLNAILKSDKRLSRLTPEEQEALRNVVLGTFGSRTSRSIEKLVPHSLLPLIGIASFPAAVGGAAAKFAFRKLGEHLTDQQIENLIAKVKERASVNKHQAVKNAIMRQDAKQATRHQTFRSGVVGAENSLSSQGDALDELNAAQPQ